VGFTSLQLRAKKTPFCLTTQFYVMNKTIMMITMLCMMTVSGWCQVPGTTPVKGTTAHAVADKQKRVAWESFIPVDFDSVHLFYWYAVSKGYSRIRFEVSDSLLMYVSAGRTMMGQIDSDKLELAFIRRFDGKQFFIQLSQKGWRGYSRSSIGTANSMDVDEEYMYASMVNGWNKMINENTRMRPE
jgi:hypothetical protein